MTKAILRLRDGQQRNTVYLSGEGKLSIYGGVEKIFQIQRTFIVATPTKCNINWVAQSGGLLPWFLCSSVFLFLLGFVKMVSSVLKPFHSKKLTLGSIENLFYFIELCSNWTFGGVCQDMLFNLNVAHVTKDFRLYIFARSKHSL